MKWFLPLVALAAITGCSQGIKPPYSAPVTGSVTARGVPLAGVLVRFHPLFDLAYIPLGETNNDGVFSLSTAAAGNGAPPGEYVVTFEKLQTVTDFENSGIETEVDEFQGRYSNPETSPWTVVIEDGENELEPFELE